MKVVLRALEWGIFANEFALLSSYGMIVGGFVSVVYMFSKWQIGIFSLITGIMVFVLEYPRSYREDSKFVERRFQKYLVPCIIAIGVCARNFYFRSVIYFFFSIPCFFLLPTFIGGACIISASFVYLFAAFHGFEWKQPPFECIHHYSSDNSLTSNNSIILKETVC